MGCERGKIKAGVAIRPDALWSPQAIVPSPDMLPDVTVAGDEPGTVTTVPRLPPDGIDLKAHLANIEQGLIRQALDEAEGVVAHAAKRLKMRRTTLVEKLRKYGLQRGSDLGL